MVQNGRSRSVGNVKFGAPVNLRIAVADSVTAARTSLRQVVEGPLGWQVVGEAADGFEAVRVARATAADVLLVECTIGGLPLSDIRALLASSHTVVVGLLDRPEQHAAQTGPSTLKTVPADALRTRILAAVEERWHLGGVVGT
jgi:DNA-binding NarL/FixJ family response regulator